MNLSKSWRFVGGVQISHMHCMHCFYVVVVRLARATSYRRLRGWKIFKFYRITMLLWVSKDTMGRARVGQCQGKVRALALQSCFIANLMAIAWGRTHFLHRKVWKRGWGVPWETSRGGAGFGARPRNRSRPYGEVACISGLFFRFFLGLWLRIFGFVLLELWVSWPMVVLS